METLTRLVSESFARHGFDRPLDYRRLQWSRWFACESPRSLLLVPSKPGIFALAEEITSPAVEERRFSTALGATHNGASAPVVSDTGLQIPDAGAAKRMLAVLQFCEDDDMAFVLDRMFSRPNPMFARLASGRCFVRYVVLQDATQRRNICNALNQWLISSSEAATGIGAHFATSLEISDSAVGQRSVARTLPSTSSGQALSATADSGTKAEKQAGTGPAEAVSIAISQNLTSGAAANLHCPQPFPSGF